MMEVLTDFATVQYFGVQTVSVGVYTAWKGSYDFGSAVQLASLVLLFAVAVLAGERLMRGRARFTQHGGHGRGLAAGAAPGRARPARHRGLPAGALRGRVRAGRAAGLVGGRRGAAATASPALDAGFAEYLSNSRHRRGDRVADLRVRSRWSSGTRSGSAAGARAAGRRAADHVRLRGARRGDRHRHPAHVRLARPGSSSGSASRAAPACWSPARWSASSTPTPSASSGRPTRPSTRRTRRCRPR